LFAADIVYGKSFKTVGGEYYENYRTGVSPTTFTRVASAGKCLPLGDALKQKLALVPGWNVDVNPQTDAFSVAIKSHSNVYHFYKPDFWWRASVDVRYGENCRLIGFSLYDTAICPGPPGKDNPFVPPFRDCFYRTPLGSDAENELSKKIQEVLLPLAAN
jgi:hypothetical protein